MRNGKYAARRSSGTKVFSLMLAVLLLVGCSIGATLAWLTATTNVVENTFTVGKVAITLQEHEYVEATNSLNKTAATVQSNEYKLIPGKNMPKDPYVTVQAGSEKCWLFIAVTETNNVLDERTDARAVAFNVDEKAGNTGTWNGLADLGNRKKNVSVFYTIVDSDAAKDQNIYVLKILKNCTDTTHTNGCVTVASEIDSTWNTAPTLTFNAAAIQYDGLEPAEGQDELTAAMAAFNQLPQAFRDLCLEPVSEPET